MSLAAQGKLDVVGGGALPSNAFNVGRLLQPEPRPLRGRDEHNRWGLDGLNSQEFAQNRKVDEMHLQHVDD